MGELQVLDISWGSRSKVMLKLELVEVFVGTADALVVQGALAQVLPLLRPVVGRGCALLARVVALRLYQTGLRVRVSDCFVK